MDLEQINKIHSRIYFQVKAGEHNIETHRGVENLNIVQYKDYTIKKYTFFVKTTEDTFVSIKVKDGNKWVEKQGNSFDFDIDKPFKEIQVSFAVSSIPPIKLKLTVNYANKKEWDERVERDRINKLDSEFSLGIYSGNDFAWFLSKKPNWLDHFVITLKLGDYEFCKVSSNKKDHLLIDKLPNGHYVAVFEVFDSKGLAYSSEKDFKIKSRAVDPERHCCVDLWAN